MTSVVWEKVDRIASHAPLFVAPNEDLRGAASTMWQYNVGVLLVGDQRRLLGVISERDLVAALARGVNPDTTTVADAMTSDVVSVRPGDSIYDAAAKMLDLGIRHVPVVDERGEVKGVLSVRDALRPLLITTLAG